MLKLTAWHVLSTPGFRENPVHDYWYLYEIMCEILPRNHGLSQYLISAFIS